MSQDLIVFLIIYAVISMITLVFFGIAALDETSVVFKSPKGIYNSIRVNWFGAVVIFILLAIACPLGYIFYVIPKFLFTVGRKQHDA